MVPLPFEMAPRLKATTLSGAALPMNLRRRDVGSDLVRGRTLASLRAPRFDHLVVSLPRLHSMVDVAGSSDRRFRIELDHSCRAATDNEDGRKRAVQLFSV
jgi:hypothetical protein